MSGLIDRLPEVRGRYRENADLSRVAWFRVGGPAEVLFQPADADDLVEFLRERPKDVPVTVIGVASNMLIRDGGIEGVVVRLGGVLKRTSVEDGVISAEAGLLDRSLAMKAAEHALAGLEFYFGIPGTVGGAVRMNAGCFGGETRDVLIDAPVVDLEGNRFLMSRSELGFSYRHSELAPDRIVLGARFRGEPGDPAAIRRRMEEIKQERGESQPLSVATGGSTFKNPPGASAWRLIDEAGCRGLEIGTAQVDTKHCNFLVNRGGARAADLERLGETVRERVLAKCGIALEWEIRRIGREPRP